MNNIDLIGEEIVEEFSVFEDWIDKYNYLIEMGRDLAPLADKYRSSEYLINGCQSRMWLGAEYQDGKVIFQADSDAVITKGMVSLLIRLMSGQTPKDIINTDLACLEAIGLRKNLSPTRSNGLNSMIKQMKMYALAFDTQQK